jgi:integrase
MASLRKRGKVWYYRYVDAEGTKREVKGCGDKRATEELARAAESEAAKVRAGVIDVKCEARRRHAARPLADHLADWHAHLLAEGHTSKHAGLSLERVRRVVSLIKGTALAEIAPSRRTKHAARAAFASRVEALMRSARLADLDRDRTQNALATLRDSGLSLQSANHHRAAIRAFVRWAWLDGRTAENPLVALAGYNVAEDRRHDRRTLALDELHLLIDAAHKGPAYREMTGPARALCYRLAVATGLRFSEIASIKPGSFALASDRPSVTVAAAYTKNGEPATLPLPADLVADLAGLVATIPAEAPVFPLPDKGAAMLKADLVAAGIPYRDVAGRVFDFHALRCQCATLADAAGVSPRVVQRLMRHSTLELTGRYTRPRDADLEKAADALPSLRPGSPDTRSAARATGTTEGGLINRCLAHHLPTAGDTSRQDMSDPGRVAQTTPDEGDWRNPLEMTHLDASWQELAGNEANTPERIRTSNLRFRRRRRQLLEEPRKFNAAWILSRTPPIARDVVPSHVFAEKRGI